MGKKKINGTLKYTAENCRSIVKKLETRCDYDKISEALGEINQHIKQALEQGDFQTKVGRTFSHTVLSVLIFASDWENDDSLFLSVPEWRIVIKELNDAGFTMKESAETDYLIISWKVE